MFEFLASGSIHLDDVLTLENEVLSGLERPDLLRHNTVEMWQQCLKDPHTTLGVRADERLVALAVLYLPGTGSEENLSTYLRGISAQGLCGANYKICMVHPKWRGYRLQEQLGQQLEVVARRQGIQLLCSTVSPHNFVSRHNMEKLGYQLDGTIIKYGFDRMLYYKLLQDG